MPETLRKRGHHVEVVPVYETVMEEPDPEVKGAILSGEVDLVTFTASSTVHNFVEIMGGREGIQGLPETLRVASIGPITSQTLREYGLPVHVEAPVYTIDDLIREIVAAFAS
ncbi:MAG: hypothetical protein DSY91_05695 [Deltaproteobacteria bacterium]|nr:MAG: hypothetical protein DSY91_05695 [Deltaproteobacteria bacterium]